MHPPRNHSLTAIGGAKFILFFLSEGDRQRMLFVWLSLLLGPSLGLLGDCGEDRLSLVSFSGGLYSQGQPYECIRDTARHWCELSVLSNMSKINPFFSYVAPLSVCVKRTCNASDLVSFLSSAVPDLPAVVDAWCWPDDPRTKDANWTVAGALVLGGFFALCLFELIVTCWLETRPAKAENEPLLEVNASPKKDNHSESVLSAFDVSLPPPVLFVLSSLLFTSGEPGWRS
jgi:hypothetical protein